MAGDRSQRTEQPTGKRLSDERAKGNVPRTKELPAALTLLGILIFGHVFGAAWLVRLRELVADSLSTLARADLGNSDAVVLLGGMLSTTALLLLPPLGVLLVTGVGGSLLQGPPPLTTRPLKLDLSRINPMSGLRKLFQLRSWLESLKLLLKMVLFTAIAVSAVREALVEGLPGAPGAEGTLSALFLLAGKVVFRVAMLALALAVLDLLYTRFDYRRRLRMTKQEVKDERRQTEGDPLIKARVRSKQITLSRSRMLADVARASVVITNPTHFAVALRYVPGEMDVPRVLAKGRGRLAERIRAAAIEHRVPIVSDPPLARALYRAVQVGGYIPTQLYRAVAEVVAFVLRGKTRRTAAREEA